MASLVHVRRVKRSFILLLLALVACNDRYASDEDVNAILDYGKAHPPVSDATWRDVAVLECRPKSVAVCDEEGCKDGGEPKVFSRWKPATGVYERCDGVAPCSSFNATVSHSGAFTNIGLPQNGMLTRVTGSGAYVEVATLLDTVLVYRGQCQRR